MRLEAKIAEAMLQTISDGHAAFYKQGESTRMRFDSVVIEFAGSVPTVYFKWKDETMCSMKLDSVPESGSLTLGGFRGEMDVTLI